MLQPGLRLNEYEIIRVLGEGGFGVTYLAFDHTMDGPVAIKEYYPSDYAYRPDGTSVAPKSGEAETVYRWGYEKFIEEAKLMSRLRHRNLVQVRRYFEAHNTVYLVMEYLEGEPLSSVVRDGGPLTESEWQPWLKALLDGLKQIHKLGFLHRDIKPDNIMICADGDGESTPVFIDFGAARPPTGSAGKPVTTIYTAGYAPLEQQSEEDLPQGAYTDIYAVACVTLEVLTGKQPPDARARQGTDPVPRLLEGLRGKVSEAFVDALRWGLELHSENRPPTVDAWLAALEGASQAPAAPSPGQAVAAPPRASAYQPGAAPERVPASAGDAGSRGSRGLLTALAVIVVLGGVGGAGAWFYDQQQQVGQGLERRLASCRGIDHASQPDASVRCFRRIEETYGENSEATESIEQTFGLWYDQIRSLIGEGRYDDALLAIEQAGNAGGDDGELQTLRRSITTTLQNGAESSLRAGDIAGALAAIEDFEKYGGDPDTAARLRADTAARRSAAEARGAAFAQCQGLLEARRFTEAHDCYELLGEEYPGALDELAEVKSALGEHIDDRIANGDLDNAERYIAEAKGLGISMNAAESALQQRRDAEEEARRLERARQRQLALDEAQRLDRARATYGFVLDGQFEPDADAFRFRVSGVSSAAQRSLPIKSGDFVERVDNEPIEDIESVRRQLAANPSLVEDFSDGVPDSRVLEELLLRPLDENDGTVRMRLRRNGRPIVQFCRSNGSSIQCR